MIATYPRWIDVFETSLIRWVCTLLVWLGLSALWSDPLLIGDVASVWVRCVLVFCFVAGFAECQMRDQLQQWLGTALLVVGGMALVAAMVNFWITQPADNRLNGLGQLDTHVVAALVFGVVLVFGLHFLMRSQTKPPIVRGLYLAVILLCAIGVFLSDSRNAIACVLFASIALIFAHTISERKHFVLAMLCLALLGLILLVIAFNLPPLYKVAFPRGDSFRIQLWIETIRMLNEGSLLFGLGINTPDDIVMDDFVAMHPHNLYLAVLYQGGMVGLFLYCVMLFKALRVLLENYEFADAKLALAIFAIALPSHLIDGHELVDKISDTWFLIWLPTAIAVGLSWRYDKTTPLND